jgi:hypothetical protein
MTTVAPARVGSGVDPVDFILQQEMGTMSRLLQLTLAFVFTASVAACGDDDPVAPVDPLDPFVGSWSASSFVYTSVDDPEVSIPILQVVPGSSVAVQVEAGGSFVASLNLGPQTDGETVDIPGTITHEGGSSITVVFATNPFFTEPLDVTYNFETANTLSWEAPTNFDFNQDGEQTPAILTVVFQRS